MEEAKEECIRSAKDEVELIAFPSIPSHHMILALRVDIRQQAVANWLDEIVAEGIAGNTSAKCRQTRHHQTFARSRDFNVTDPRQLHSQSFGRRHPSCPCSGPRSSTWAASSRPAPFATTPSERSLRRMRPRGKAHLSISPSPHLCVARQIAGKIAQINRRKCANPWSENRANLCFFLLFLDKLFDT